MKIFTTDEYKITKTDESYDEHGNYLPMKYQLEDGSELELDDCQFVNTTDINGNGGHNPIRFKLKELEK